MRKKYIFVTGGVLSSLGKGVSASAIAALLEARGVHVTMLKMDPYINVDPGTMSPYQHGEVFVTHDGAETDLDLGHYERFTRGRMVQRNNFTSGSVYQRVIERERKGDYLGRTVQVIPHITDEIKRRIHLAAADADLLIAEVGGTVGDIESLPFLEAIRQMRHDAGAGDVLFVHVTLVPYIKTAGELKTKPTQHSVKELLQVGIQPDILLCRSDRGLPRDIKQKIASFCNLRDVDVISAADVDTIYALPQWFQQEELDVRICEKLGIWASSAHMDPWRDIVERVRAPATAVRIGIVGKYVHLADTYKSLNEALLHGGIANDCRVELVYVDSEDAAKVGGRLADVDGVLVPGGFGERGVEGKIDAIRRAREGNVPFFGICLGLQLAVVEFARNALQLVGAMSREFDADPSHPVIEVMNEQREVSNKGGTMRLGAYPCDLVAGTRAHRIYERERIDERHRHRYEVNPAYHQRISDGGMVISGWSPDRKLVEVVELPDHPWFVACQFHPEFESRPLRPHPLFVSFIRAALARRRERA
jgi:CTP synthase